MPERNNGLGATQVTFADNLIRGGAPVSVKGPYPGAVWTGNIIWNTGGGDMPLSGYRSEDVDENQFKAILPGESAKYPQIPKDNRPLTIADVGPLAK